MITTPHKQGVVDTPVNTFDDQDGFRLWDTLLTLALEENLTVREDWLTFSVFLSWYLEDTQGRKDNQLVARHGILELQQPPPGLFKRILQVFWT